MYIKSGIEFEKFIDGGHQENNKRAGTENVAQIVGLGKACEIARENLDKHMKYLRELRDYYINEIETRIPNVKLNGDRKMRLPGNANFSFKGVSGETLLLKLDERQMCASTGSACSSGSLEPSHVLTAIGLSKEDANSSLRTTFGEINTKEDVKELADSLVEIVEDLRKANN